MLPSSPGQAIGPITNSGDATSPFPRGFCFPKNLQLRPRKDQDATDLHHLLMQESFLRYGTSLDPFRSLEDVEVFLASGGSDKIEVVATINDAIVGFSGLYMLPGRQAHVGSFTMGVHQNFQQIGIGSVLMKAIIKTGFGLLGLHRIQATVFTDNTRALSLYRRFGFTAEGTLSRFARREDGFIDAYLIAMVR